MTMTDTSRRSFLAGSAALAAGAALPLQAAPADDTAARALLDRVGEELLAAYPEAASYLGIDTGSRAGLKAALTDKSAAAEGARTAWARRTHAELRGIDRARLAPGTAADLDVVETAFALALDGWRFPYGDMAAISNNNFRNTPYVVSQLAGAFVDVPDFLDSRHVVKSAADADAYLARVEAYAGELTAETARIAADAARGVILPDVLLDITAGQMAAALAQPVAQWTLVASLATRARSADLPARYAEAATRLAADKVMPALRAQEAALRALRPRATPAVAATRLPDGEAYYAWLLRAGTTTTATADEMHRLGQEQVAALQARMDTILKAQGLTQGSVGDRMTALSKRPDLLFPNTEAGRAQLLAYLEGRIADIRARLPRAFAMPVPGKLVIRRVPPAIQDGAPNGYAGPGTIDGSQPGIYYINLKDTAAWPRYSLPTLCYHEGLPGHVWQGEYTFKLPLIRTLLAFNAYSEGWALYSEQLADELGAYDGDPLGRLGYLQSIAFRACRLVVDTGLHAKGWTVPQALAWFEANTGMPRAHLVGEVNRYCAMPGQACGYKMGHNEINRLRDRARAALGDRFDLRRFDDAVVLGGNVPLTLLARSIDRYVTTAKG